MAVTQALGQFISTLQWSEASPKVRALMPVLMLDYFRAALAGQDRAWTDAVTALYRSHNPKYLKL